jgi:hypothetical protein
LPTENGNVQDSYKFNTNKIYYQANNHAMDKKTSLNLYQKFLSPHLKDLKLIKGTGFVFLTQIIKTDGCMLA